MEADTPARRGTPQRRKLSFYRRLSPAEKREYDRSDALGEIPVAPSAALARATDVLVAAVEGGKTAVVRKASQDLVDALCAALGRSLRRRIEAPAIRVLRVRPRKAGAEYHGLYTRTAAGVCEIRVWLITARERRVVKPRTFLRTLLHEVGHHLDIDAFGLPRSIHTLGFHARESSLVRALERSGARIPGGKKVARPGTRAVSVAPPPEEPVVPSPISATPPAKPSPARAKKPASGRQLDLFS